MEWFLVVIGISDALVKGKISTIPMKKRLVFPG